MIRSARTPRERRFKIAIAITWVLVVASLVIMQPWVWALGRHEHWIFETYRTVWVAFWFSYAMIAGTISVVTIRQLFAIQTKDIAAGLIRPSAVQPGNARKTTWWITGLYIASCWWLIDLAWKVGDRLPALILSAMMIGLLIWNARQARVKTGDAGMRMHLKHLVGINGVMLLVLNWRLGVWVAARTENVQYVEVQRLFSNTTDKLSYLTVIDPAGVDRLLPMWIVHVLTLALVAWVVVLMAMTRPKALK